MKTNIGILGLAVMGENLAINIESKGFRVSVFDVREGVVDNFIQGRGKGRNFCGAHSFEDFVQSIEPPRKIMLMIRAGAPVDEVVGKLLPLLDRGDVIIDGGNSHFADTARRVELAESCGILYVGAGVSGGEEGALHGPSIMPGGSPAAWPLIKPILQAISAKTRDGTPCCDWVGEGGAGHFVKMVHNGIEYGDMQLICEAYHIMKDYLGMTCDEMHAVFEKWNKGKLDSYLIKITADILAFRDTDGAPLIDHILDTAGQKGTGKWTVITALDEGVPLTLIGEAVFARCLSAAKEERVAASEVLKMDLPEFDGDREAFLEDLEGALYASKIVSYAQGFSLMRSAAKTYGWNLNYGGIALMWRGGCIIRSAFLGKIKEAFERNPELTNLLLDRYFAKAVADAETGWRRVCACALTAGIPVPAMCAALTYLDGYRCKRLPANLLQAQRDYFGAHTYERTDAPRGKYFHTNWTGEGGSTASTKYNV
jgi:6-phosphogluconate dehydrogenase